MKLKLLFIMLQISITLLLLRTYTYTQVQRNLADYTVGPTFEDHDSRFPTTEEDKIVIFKELREYLWNAWSERKLTYFRLYTYSLEGRRMSRIFFVEKENGLWQVTVEYDCKNDTSFQSEELCRENRNNKYVYDKIEKIDVKNTFRLLLTNSKSKEKIKF